MKILISLFGIFVTNILTGQEYNTIHKEAANSATLSFISANTKWRDITKLIRHLAKCGFYYITIRYEDKSFTVSESSRNVSVVSINQKIETQSDLDHYITLQEDRVLSIVFPEIVDDEEFVAELKQIKQDTYDVILSPQDTMDIQQVFQVMSLICAHIDIGAILIVRRLSKEEFDSTIKSFTDEFKKYEFIIIGEIGAPIKFEIGASQQKRLAFRLLYAIFLLSLSLY